MGGLGDRRVRVVDHDHAVVQHHGVAGRRLTAHVGERADDDQRVDAALVEQLLQVGRTLDQGAEPVLVDHQVALVEFERLPQAMSRRVALDRTERRGAVGPAVDREERRPRRRQFVGFERHPDPRHGAARIPHRRGEPVDVRHDVACRRDLERRARFDEEVLHVDHDERRGRRVEFVDHAQLATHLVDGVDDVGGDVGLAHADESVTEPTRRPQILVCVKISEDRSSEILTQTTDWATVRS